MILRKKPITCDEVRALLFEFAENSLDAWEMARVKAHIESCPECEKELETVKSIFAAFPECSDEPPSALYGNVMKAIENESQDAAPLKSKKRYIPYGAAAAACAAVMIVVAGRHVIPMTDSIAIDNGAVIVTEANKDADVSAAEPLPEGEAVDKSAPVEVLTVNAPELPTLRVIDGGDSIEVSTSSLQVSAPAYTDIKYSDTPDEPVLTEASETDAYKDDLFTVFNYVKNAEFTGRIAVIVCNSRDITEDISAFYSETLVHKGVSADRYIISENAMPHFVDTLSITENKYWKLPDDLGSFGVYHLYLVTDSEG